MGKYLVALSGSFSRTDADQVSAPPNGGHPSPHRKQLYILYLLNDLLHHAKYHAPEIPYLINVTTGLENHLSDLLSKASGYDESTFPKQRRKIYKLLDIWDQHGYFSATSIRTLRDIVTSGGITLENSSSTDIQILNGKANGAHDEKPVDREYPFLMPATHGDESTPYYDLPAGNLMPHILPNSTRPIDPQLVRALKFVAGPADEQLILAVKDFMRDVTASGGTQLDDDETVSLDIDELGQSMVIDGITKEPLEGEGYYGWSKAFCQRMKRRKDGVEELPRGRTRDESVGRSLSPSGRRRYSSSRSRRSSRSFGSSRSRSRARMRNPTSRKRRRSYSRGSDASEERSDSREARFRSLRSQSRSVSRMRSSPKPSQALATGPRTQLTQPSSNVNAPSLVPAQNQSPAPILLPNLFTQAFPFGPVPPPRPPNYIGQWPPPPPPPPMQGSVQFPTFTPAPPHPPSGPHGFPVSVSPPLPAGSRNGLAANWTQNQQPSGSSGYPYDSGTPAYASYQGQTHNSRGRGRGGWR